MRMPVNHFSSSTISEDAVRKRIRRIERILQSRQSPQQLLEDDLANALGKVESLLEQTFSPKTNPQPLNNAAINEAPAGSTSSPSTTGGSQNSHASGRPVLFAEASNKRWSVDSAVGKAATGVQYIYRNYADGILDIPD